MLESFLRTIYEHERLDYLKLLVLVLVVMAVPADGLLLNLLDLLQLRLPLLEGLLR